jgi:hypothetical protein
MLLNKFHKLAVLFYTTKTNIAMANDNSTQHETPPSQATASEPNGKPCQTPFYGNWRTVMLFEPVEHKPSTQYKSLQSLALYLKYSTVPCSLYQYGHNARITEGGENATMRIADFVIRVNKATPTRYDVYRERNRTESLMYSGLLAMMVRFLIEKEVNENKVIYQQPF